MGNDPRMERSLSSFQHSVVIWITGRQPRRPGVGSWEYPSLEEAMSEAGFKGIRTYVTSRQNMVAQYISTRMILDLCEQFNRRPGAWVSRRWWEQDCLYLEGAKNSAAAESDASQYNL